MNAVPAKYNEIDAYAARWLRNLMYMGHIPKGEVDERSIVELTATDVEGPGQRHFFAGIGVWAHALRLSGWPDDFPVWTGSCPCQPWSVAGAGNGFDDARHLWPEWHRLIKLARPLVVVGEQVADGGGLAWLDSVQNDMEAESYAFAAFDLGAATVGAPHQRQRLYFAAFRNNALREIVQRLTGQPPYSLADDDDEQRQRQLGSTRVHDRGQLGNDANGRGEAGALAEPESARRLHGSERGSGCSSESEGPRGIGPERRSGAPLDERLVHADEQHAWRNAGTTAREEAKNSSERPQRRRGRLESVDPSAAHFWREVDWLECRDGKLRPVEPGTFPLADGVAARVGQLRAYGNACVGPLAAEFLRCLRDSLIELGAGA